MLEVVDRQSSSLSQRPVQRFVSPETLRQRPSPRPVPQVASLTPGVVHGVMRTSSSHGQVETASEQTSTVSPETVTASTVGK